MKRYRYILSVLVLSVAVSATAATAPQSDVIGDRDAAYEYMRVFAEVLLQVRKGYVETNSIAYQDLIYNAMDGMLRSLDPHSQFMTPEAYRDMREDTAGKFAGIGIVIGLREAGLTVISPIEDTPAERAGLESDDLIMEINGEPTEDMSLRDAVSRLRGEKGTTVQVKVGRVAPEFEELEIEMTRDEIRVKSVKGARMLSDEIGYARITSFNHPTAETLATEVQMLSTQGMQALVLDLRDNPGGLLQSAIAVSSLFLEPGELIVTTRSPKFSRPNYARNKKPRSDLLLAILVNRGSASASEIVAASLQDHHRAVVVGQRTFGKGSVQSVLPLSDGSAVRLTTARYFTPSERIIHDNGIEPDIFVPIDRQSWRDVKAHRQRVENPEHFSTEEPDAAANAVDLQLDRAVEVLQGVMLLQANERSGD